MSNLIYNCIMLQCKSTFQTVVNACGCQFRQNLNGKLVNYNALFEVNKYLYNHFMQYTLQI